MLNMRTTMDRIELSEGFFRTTGKDPGKGYDIGFGHSITYNKLTPAEQKLVHYDENGSMSITKAGAEQLLKNDINKFTAELDKQIPWWRTLDDERQFVILDMAYTLGTGGLCKHKKFLAAMKSKDYETAAVIMLKSKWYSQVGNRGARDYVLLKTGVYNKNVTQKNITKYSSGNISADPAPTYTQTSGSSNSGYSISTTGSSNSGYSISTTGSSSSRSTKQAMKKDQKAAQKKQKKVQKAEAKAENKAKKAEAKAETKEAKTKAKMEKLINELNTKTKSKLDAKKTSDALYKKYGAKSYKKLKEAISKPAKYGAKTSVAAVRKLVESPKEKTRAKKISKTNQGR